jgi:peroxisomal coenzyme A diphosphatase NUDT7
MKIDLEKLKSRKISVCGMDICKEFSVLVPIVESAGEYSLLFEVRSESLNNQPNEICFPGGKIESMEESVNAAVRETSEELLLPENNIKVIGQLDTLVTPFNTVIYPFVGLLHDYHGKYNIDEVKETFYIPLSFLMETEPLCRYIDIEMKPREGFPYEMIQNGRNYPWAKGKYPVYFYTYEDRIVWGITARITYNFIQLLKADTPR